LDGNEIMRVLDLRPGPLVGQAWRYLLELRIERGPMSRDEAVEALRTWARQRGSDAG
jgi:poly(A) polymerase